LEAANIDTNIGCDVKDGKLRILFREKRFGINVHSAVYSIKDAVNAAPQPAGSSPRMSFTARQSVKQKYDSRIEEVRLRVAAILGVPSIEFTPNFEQIFQELKERERTARISPIWEEWLGGIGFNYFKDAFLDTVERRFANDEILCEGFQEAVYRNEVSLRIVKKLVRRNQFEAVIEDGVLYIQVR
jgi:hypothetical protein